MKSEASTGIRSLGEGLPTVARVPPGEYSIGDTDIPEGEAPNPRRVVVISAFSMGVHPVTNAEYCRFASDTGASLPACWEDARFCADDQPVVDVSWQAALSFCRWAGGELPTEAQWEVCARGADGRTFPWGDDEPTAAQAHFAQDWNQGGTSRCGRHPEGTGPFGHQDLAGNVWEWCMDAWCVDEAILLASRSDPIVNVNSPVRPLRGGCWRSITPKLQAAYRNWFHRVAQHVTIGFRICVPG